MNQKWDKRFLKIAKEISTWSKDTSTKVGCVIVSPDRRILTTGYNGIPRGCEDDPDKYPERHIRPSEGGQKYSWYEHSERNAIYNAACEGIKLKGCTIYVTTSLPCVDCARGIIQSQIKRVVWEKPHDPNFVKRWADSMKISEQMFQEAGIETVSISLL